MKILAFKFLNLLKYSSLTGMSFGAIIGLNKPGDIDIKYKNNPKKKYDIRTIAPIFIGGIFGIIFPLSIIALPFSLINFFTKSSCVEKIIDNAIEKYNIKLDRCYQYGEKSKYDYP